MKHIVITGGSSGIGEAIVNKLLDLDVQIYNFDLIKSKEISRVNHIYCDLNNHSSIAEAFIQLSLYIDKIDVVLNNAGISRNNILQNITLPEWNEVLQINLTAPFLITQAAINYMQHGGVIINTASVSGMIGMPNYLSYNVSKAGLIEMTKTLALELAPKIRVNAICPGYVMTLMQKKEYTQDEIIKSINKIPLKRWANVDEIAALVSYLISKEASFITGQTFVIDGGEIAGGLAS